MVSLFVITRKHIEEIWHLRDIQRNTALAGHVSEAASNESTDVMSDMTELPRGRDGAE